MRTFLHKKFIYACLAAFSPETVMRIKCLVMFSVSNMDIWQLT